MDSLVNPPPLPPLPSSLREARRTAPCSLSSAACWLEPARSKLPNGKVASNSNSTESLTGENRGRQTSQAASVSRARERDEEEEVAAMEQLVQQQVESNLLHIANTIEQSLDDEMHR